MTDIGLELDDEEIQPVCPVRGCNAASPHTEDAVVAGLMKVFSPSHSLAYWSLASMSDLRDSIISDIQAGRHFAWQTRLRQVEEIYFRALYCLFIATDKELPHVFAGAMPNSAMPMYRKVNELILKGRGEWEKPHPGQSSGQFTPASILHSSAHASYVAMYTAISYHRLAKSEVRVDDGYIKHLNTYCDRLEYMHNMFKAGKDKETVLGTMISMHTPLSDWQNLTQAQTTDETATEPRTEGDGE